MANQYKTCPYCLRAIIGHAMNSHIMFTCEGKGNPFRAGS